MSASKKTPTRSAKDGTGEVASAAVTPAAVPASAGSASKKDDCLEVTAQAVADFEEELRLRREQLTMFKRPVQTLRVFALAVVSLASHVVRHWLTHPVFIYVLLPLMPTWYAVRRISGPHLALMHKVEFFMEFFVWWVGLGISSRCALRKPCCPLASQTHPPSPLPPPSSIGLGSGLQSGVLFLFPHIIKTCLAAQTCQTLDFVSSSNMWFRKPANLFKCPPLTPHSTPVTFVGLWLKVLITFLLKFLKLCWFFYIWFLCHLSKILRISNKLSFSKVCIISCIIFIWFSISSCANLTCRTIKSSNSCCCFFSVSLREMSRRDTIYL